MIYPLPAVCTAVVELERSARGKFSCSNASHSTYSPYVRTYEANAIHSWRLMAIATFSSRKYIFLFFLLCSLLRAESQILKNSLLNDGSKTLNLHWESLATPSLFIFVPYPDFL